MEAPWRVCVGASYRTTRPFSVTYPTFGTCLVAWAFSPSTEGPSLKVSMCSYSSGFKGQIALRQISVVATVKFSREVKACGVRVVANNTSMGIAWLGSVR